MKWDPLARGNVKNLIFTLFIYFVFFSLLPPMSQAQIVPSKTLSSFGSIINPTDPVPSPTRPGQVTTVGNRIVDANGQTLLLVGGNIAGFSVNIGSALSDSTINEEKIRIIKDKGANFVSIAMNAEFWITEPRRGEYQQRVADIVSWCRKHRMYYRLELHQDGASSNTIGELFSSAGRNWKIAEIEPYRSNAIKMFEQLTDLYGDDPNFVGFGLLNEPRGADDFIKWDVCVEYYYDAIQAVTSRPKGKDMNFFILEPYHYGGYTEHWGTVQGGKMRDFIDYPHIIYEFHNYHWNKRWGDAEKSWAWEYEVGNNFAQGRADLLNYHNKFVPMENHPLYCGEFSIGVTPDQYRNGGQCVSDQMDQMVTLGISHSIHSLYNNHGNDRHRIFNSDGTGLTESGLVWASNIPQNLGRPPSR